MKIDLDNLSKLDKYRENLLVSDDAVFSYLTRGKYETIFKTSTRR